jgi:hypothetical protein
MMMMPCQHQLLTKEKKRGKENIGCFHDVLSNHFIFLIRFVVKTLLFSSLCNEVVHSVAAASMQYAMVTG